MLNRYYIIPRAGRIAYLNIAKSACSTILMALSKMRANPNYAPPRDLLDDGSLKIHGFHPDYSHIDFFLRRWPSGYPPLPENIFKFTFVRNPYDRFYSFYKSKIRDGQKPGDYYLKFGLDSKSSFAKCVEVITSLPPEELENHAAPQSMIICQNNNLLVDFIGKIEEFNKDWQIVCFYSGFKIELEHLNKTISAESSIFTENCKSLIYHYYRDDFELFNYAKDSVETSDSENRPILNECNPPNYNKLEIIELRNIIQRGNTEVRENYKKNFDGLEKILLDQNENLLEIILKANHICEKDIIDIKSNIWGYLKNSRRNLKLLEDKVDKLLDSKFNDEISLLKSKTSINTNQIQKIISALKIQVNNQNNLLEIYKLLDDDINTNSSHLQTILKQQKDIKTKSTIQKSEIAENKSEIKRLFQFKNTIEGKVDSSIKKVDKSILELNNYEKKIKNTILCVYKSRRINFFKRIYYFFKNAFRNEFKIILKSRLFDQYYYYRNYPHACSFGIPAIKHYVLYGAAEGYNPSDSFNTVEYIQKNPDCVLKAINPLVHFIISHRMF